MHVEDGFTLYPSTSIAADTPTREFSASKIQSFYLVVVVTALGVSQTVTPRLQMVLPDGTTWVTIASVGTAIAATGTYVYGFGWNMAGISEAEVLEVHNTPLTARMRVLWDVFNVANATIVAHLIPGS